MTKLQLGIAAAALGIGVLSQIPKHDHENMAGHAHDLSDQHAAMAAADPDHGLTVQLAVTGMTWTACATTARVALQRVSGVHSADVSYETGEGVVSFDPSITSPDEFIAQLARMTGFGATVVDTLRAQETQQ